MKPASGARLHANYYRPGGVNRDLPAGLDERIAEWAEAFPKFVDELEDLLTANRIWKQRTVDIGIMSAGGRAGLGLRRPAASAPAACLGSAASRSPTTSTRRSSSTCRSAATATATTAIWSAWRRCGRACSIIRQCLAKMQPGPVQDPGPQVHAAAPGRDEALDGGADPSLQALHRGLPRPAGATYTATESPKGEFGVYLVADGTNRPYRCKIRPTGFAFLQAIESWRSATCWPTRWRSSGRSTSCSARSTGRPWPKTRRDAERSRRSRRASPSTRRARRRSSARSRSIRPAAGERGHSAALCRAEPDAAADRQRLGAARRDGRGGAPARYGADPRLRGRDLLLHVQHAADRQVPPAGLRHDAVLAARLGRRSRAPAATRPASRAGARPAPTGCSP